MRVSLVPVAFAGFFLKILSNDSLIPDDRFCENKLIYSKHVVLGVHLFDVFIQFYPLFFFTNTKDCCMYWIFLSANKEFVSKYKTTSDDVNTQKREWYFFSEIIH